MFSFIKAYSKATSAKMEVKYKYSSAPWNEDSEAKLLTIQLTWNINMLESNSIENRGKIVREI